MSLEQIRAFLEASEPVRFVGKNRREVYDWVTRTWKQQRYEQCGREAKGLLRRYVAKMSGLSRAQVTRLIGQYGDSGEVKEAPYRRHRFACRYSRAGRSSGCVKETRSCSSAFRRWRCGRRSHAR